MPDFFLLYFSCWNLQIKTLKNTMEDGTRVQAKLLVAWLLKSMVICRATPTLCYIQTNHTAWLAFYRVVKYVPLCLLFYINILTLNLFGEKYNMKIYIDFWTMSVIQWDIWPAKRLSDYWINLRVYTDEGRVILFRWWVPTELPNIIICL